MEKSALMMQKYNFLASFPSASTRPTLESDRYMITPADGSVLKVNKTLPS